MLDTRGGGRAGTVFVARHASGPAGSVQRRLGVHAVDGSPKAREEGRNSGAPYKSRCSALGEVCQGVVPGHPPPCAKVPCTDSDTIIL
jgi:hypothetical protein